MPVLDASVLVAYLSGDIHAPAAREILSSERGELWAPHLVDAEVGGALRRTVSAGELRPQAARSALRDLGDLPLRRVAHRALLDRAWALRDNVSFYDGLYIALAEALDTPLVTLDARLATAPGTRATIHVIR